MRTGIVEGTLDQSSKEVRDQVIEFNRARRAVKVEGARARTSLDSLADESRLAARQVLTCFQTSTDWIQIPVLSL